MTRSQAFSLAHALTRRTIQSGDSYAITFGQCLKAVLNGYRVETAERAADRIEGLIAANDMWSNRWTAHSGEIRIYVKQSLSRGRHQEMGYIAVDRETAEARACMSRRRAFIRDLIAA